MQDTCLLFPGFEKPVPMMPAEFMGEVKKPCGYTKTYPRSWTDKEIDWIFKLKEQGFSLDEISRSVGRTSVSIAIKMKRMGNTERRYNSDHLEDKYAANRTFLEMIRPDSVLDLYGGSRSWWACNSDGVEVVSNDKDTRFNHTYHENAEKLVHRLYYDDCKYDIVDLDPFGSAFDCFDCAVKMARKGLVITFGELGHRRFKRLDFVERYYGIHSLEDFTTGNLVKEVLRIGLRNKKVLVPVIVKEWKRISRVYFAVGKAKITSQWM